MKAARFEASQGTLSTNVLADPDCGQDVGIPFPLKISIQRLGYVKCPLAPKAKGTSWPMGLEPIRLGKPSNFKGFKFAGSEMAEAGCLLYSIIPILRHQIRWHHHKIFKRSMSSSSCSRSREHKVDSPWQADKTLGEVHARGMF